MSFPQRTHFCGDLTPDHAGTTVTLNGWVHNVRDLGGVSFIMLRDRTGVMQVVIDPQQLKDSGMRYETCISLTGTVGKRSAETVNPNIPTGEIELKCESFVVLGPSKTLPFMLNDETQMASVGEELRIKYRYLDLRRPPMYTKLALRAAAVRKIRKFLDDRGFIETETPIITKSTPEGARDYLVPYRIQPGMFYALPQSPQQYKQLLMVAGLERYYQIAKCFRDESQRADRQPEFTQLDLEMSFIGQEDVLTLAEELTVSICNELISEFKLDRDPVEPFVRLSYDESMARYGTDKPDLRFDLAMVDLSEAVCDSGFGVFKSTVESGGKVKGIRYPGGAVLSRKEISELETLCKEFGAKGLATVSLNDGEGAISLPSGLKVRGSIAKFFGEDELVRITSEMDAKADDLLCFIADSEATCANVLSRLRNEIGTRCRLRDPRKLKFCWVLDFPLLEWDEEASRWNSVHHPFTGPKPDDLQYLDSDPGRIRADCYDIVCNGVEWASGSIRINRPDIQAKVFELLGIDAATQTERFGHMLEAFQFGAPPHGGIAPGIDRLVMLLLGEENIREVIAFPKIGQGTDPMMGAPSPIDEAQWKEVGLELTPEAAKPV